MKKVIKLNESDLQRIVKRVLNEEANKRILGEQYVSLEKKGRIGHPQQEYGFFDFKKSKNISNNKNYFNGGASEKVFGSIGIPDSIQIHYFQKVDGVFNNVNMQQNKEGDVIIITLELTTKPKDPNKKYKQKDGTEISDPEKGSWAQISITSLKEGKYIIKVKGDNENKLEFVVEHIKTTATQENLVDSGYKEKSNTDLEDGEYVGNGGSDFMNVENKDGTTTGYVITTNMIRGQWYNEKIVIKDGRVHTPPLEQIGYKLYYNPNEKDK